MAPDEPPSNSQDVELEERPTPLQPEVIPVENHVYPTGTRFVCLTIALLLSLFLGGLDTNILAQAIPSITESFSGISKIAWYSTAFAISNTAFKLCWGKAYKHFSIKPTYLVCMAIFEAGNIVCATAQSSSAVIVGRMISGFGGGGQMCGAFVILALSVKSQYRPLMMAITAFAFGLSSVAGPVLGGALVDALGWRWCFWINLPFGALAAGMMTCFYKQPPQGRPIEDTLSRKLLNLDINGAILVGGSLTCFVLTMHWIGKLPWSSPQIIGSLIGFMLLAIIFVVNERFMGDKAMFQSRLLKNRNIASNCMFALVFSGVLYPLQYLLPIQFQSIGNESAAESGVRMIPLLLTIPIVTVVSNGLLAWKSNFSSLFISGALAGTAGSIVMYTLAGKAMAGRWVGAEILTSLGVGLAIQLPISANNAAVGIEDISTATSLALFAENFGTAVFVSASQAAFTSGLVESISKGASNVSPQVLINAGAASLRTTFTESQLPAVLSAYRNACRHSHLVPVACGSAAALIAISSAIPSANRWTQRQLGRRQSAS